MTEAERYEISVLAEAAHNAREKLQWFGVCNMPPAGTPEALRASIAYEMARSELIEAEAVLRRAQSRLGTGA